MEIITDESNRLKDIAGYKEYFSFSMSFRYGIHSGAANNNIDLHLFG